MTVERNNDGWTVDSSRREPKRRTVVAFEGPIPRWIDHAVTLASDSMPIVISSPGAPAVGELKKHIALSFDPDTQYVSLQWVDDHEPTGEPVTIAMSPAGIRAIHELVAKIESMLPAGDEAR